MSCTRSSDTATGVPVADTGFTAPDATIVDTANDGRDTETADAEFATSKPKAPDFAAPAVTRTLTSKVPPGTDDTVPSGEPVAFPIPAGVPNSNPVAKASGALIDASTAR